MELSLNDIQQRITSTSVAGQFELYLINLNHRTDRKEESFAQLSNGSFSVSIFNAVETPVGWHGCALSHLSLIKYAKDKGLPYIIVAEDDILLKVDSAAVTSTINSLVQNLNEWEIFNGSPTFWDIRDNMSFLTCGRVAFSTDLVEINWGQAATFMIYGHLCYDRMLQFNISDDTQIDQYIARNFKQTAYVPAPFCVQRQSFSDISKILHDHEYENYFLEQHKILRDRCAHI